jgi:hypothetical protein
MVADTAEDKAARIVEGTAPAEPDKVADTAPPEPDKVADTAPPETGTAVGTVPAAMDTIVDIVPAAADTAVDIDCPVEAGEDTGSTEQAQSERCPAAEPPSRPTADSGSRRPAARRSKPLQATR